MSFYETKVFRKWDSAKRFLSTLDPRWWIFRGQSNANWSLSSTFERTPKPNRYCELYLLHEFQRRASLFFEQSLIPTDTLEWLALMQHYGVPTRLLDFTRSPYFASYFAVRDSLTHSDDIAVWCCSDKGLQLDASNLFSKFNFETLTYNRPLNRDPIFKQVFMTGLTRSRAEGESVRDDYGLVYPVEPFRQNQRISCQRGLFLMTGNVHMNFENNLAAMPKLMPDKLHFKKIIIHRTQKLDVFRDLDKMGIGASALFPDLEGHSMGLAEQIRFSKGEPPLSGLGTFVQDYILHSPSQVAVPPREDPAPD